jgi:hypothetical protein
MRITASVLLIFLSEFLSVLVPTIPPGFDVHSMSGDGTLEIESPVADVLLQANVLEGVRKRAPPNTSAKAPAKAPGKSLAKPPTTHTANVPTKSPAQSTPDKSISEGRFVNDKHKLPYSVKAGDLCVGLISCDEQIRTTSEDSGRGISGRDDGRFVKRSRKVKAFDGGLAPRAASCYHVFEIYADPRHHNNPKAVIEFQTDVATEHKMVDKAPEPTSTLNLITEHIIELSYKYLAWYRPA